MLVLVGHDERSFSLQINITKDITSIVQWVKDFSISFPCVLLLYGILIAFSILVLTVNTQPAIACSELAMEALQQYVGCVQGQCLFICMCICVCVCTYVYIIICMCLCMCLYMYICMCVYVCMCIYIYMQRQQSFAFIVGFERGQHLALVFLLLLWASKCLLGISDFNDKISFN